MLDITKYKIHWEPFDLEFVCDLLEYEGPLLSLYRNRITNEPFLYAWFDYDEDTHRWMVLSTSKELLNQISNNEAILSNLVTLSLSYNERIYFHDYNVNEWFLIPISELPDEYNDEITEDYDDEINNVIESEKFNEYLKTLN